MTRTCLVLAAVAALVLAGPAAAQIFPRKSKPDAARVKQLDETLRKDPDEKRRRAAVAELKEAEPRAQPDAVAVLVGVLQRDPAAAVRADAAAAIGQVKVMVPLAGVALETAAEADPSPLVRDAAQQALWEYHVIGYRSAKGADGIAGQTAEPPLAKPAAPRAAVPAPTPVVPVSVNPVPTPVPQPPAAVPQPTPVPTTEPKVGTPTRITAAPPPQLNATPEPPFARPTPTSASVPGAGIPDVTLPPVTLPPDAGPKPAATWTPPRVLPLGRPLLRR
ncbi:MAG: HEAT repeat domain-containing protein [Gemmataceae bacterium]|nr:HEAT repeat domain-containing protein [Gemmataceae bacterium]